VRGEYLPHVLVVGWALRGERVRVGEARTAVRVVADLVALDLRPNLTTGINTSQHRT